MIKADLRMHGVIGFQDHWLRLQGYEGKNLLQLIADRCFERDLGICAVTSNDLEITKGTVCDRFGYLMQFISKLPIGYRADKLGDNTLIVEKGGKIVYLVNGQIIQDESKRYNHLVVGSNQVPNGRDLEDTLGYGRDKGLIQVMGLSFVENHFGIGLERLERCKGYYDAIEGHNAQLLFSFITRSNEGAHVFAQECNKPIIAVSGAHRIRDLGVSYIDLREMPNTSNEDKFLMELKRQVSSGKFDAHKAYVPVFGFLRCFLGMKLFMVLHPEEKTFPF